MPLHIIYDSDHPGAKNNKCFETSYASQGYGHELTVELARAASQVGMVTETADVFLSRANTKSVDAVAITDMVSENTERLINAGVTPLICFSLESPLVAREFYRNIERLAGRFRHNFQFQGTANKLLPTGTQFHPMYFPVTMPVALPWVEWKDRKLLVLVNRNKRAFYSDVSTFAGKARSAISRLRFEWQKATNPWMRSKEIYRDRIEVIKHFSERSDFDLFGEGWSNPIPGFPAAYHQAALKVYRGSLPFDAKLSTVAGYKFVVCFENCAFPGYVTEKIFDCFFAGSIPVYFGAGDISDFVPEDSFVNYSKFGSLDDLERYLVGMDEKTAVTIIQQGRNFLRSEKFKRHNPANLASHFVNLALEYQKSLTVSQ